MQNLIDDKIKYKKDIFLKLKSINGWQLAKMKKSIPDMSLP